ncbi:MAG: aspartate carbamoyltransferase [Bdellovibrionales bacterium GWB1_55_8]|nr:MAG: aspartate carbamoyltransferase [Bdellovibrionales bacterium GWB1_55_8]
MADSIKHLIAAADLTEKQIRRLLDLARGFGPRVTRGEIIPLLQGKTVVNLFFENSTRTRLSFEQATRKLGGTTMNFSASTSSLSKGETLIDTAKNILAMGPHCLVVRHASAGSPHILSKELTIPVVNAGDGFHEHPTQGLLDVLTMEEKLGTVKGKRVVILGDIAHSRVARSNIHILKKLGASVAVCGPPTLLPPRPEILGVDFAFRPEELLPDADVIMALRIQMERQNRMQIPSVAEYSKIWGMSRERAKLLKPEAIILHPGPINRGVELDPEVADGPRSVILDQVFNGVLIRMAVLASVCAPEKIEEQLKISQSQPGGRHV